MEHLEPRTLLAGNVTAEVIDGNLYLRGDEFANDLHVFIPVGGETPGNWLIVNRDGTLNGEQTAMSLPPLAGQVRIFLGRGADRLLVRGLDIAARLSVNLGRGDDHFQMVRTDVAGALSVRSGNGDDSVHVTDGSASGPSDIFTGAGDDVTMVEASTFATDVSFRGGGGRDSIYPGGVFDGGLEVRPGDDPDLVTQKPRELHFDFSDGKQHGWKAGFADHDDRPDAEEFFELEAGPRPLPESLGTQGSGFMISGFNKSDDLFMFLKRRLDARHGIEAGRHYQLIIEITFASDAPTGGDGVGGSPGESVWLKAGGSGVEPETVVRDGQVRMNVDKANQGSSGPAASFVGNVANGLSPDAPRQYVSLNKKVIHSVPVRASEAGELWLLVGTESGFEATTTLYYQSIDVKVVPIVARVE